MPGPLSQVADNELYFTGLALLNPGPLKAAVTITVYSKEGDLIGTIEIELDQGQRVSRFLREFIPSSAGQVGGYVVVDSTEPIVGQELFGSQRSVFLSAVPPFVE